MPDMEKRVTFNERWLPYLLVAPQIVITLVFFFWPSGQAIWQSVLIEDSFGGNIEVRLVRQFHPALPATSDYYASARLTLVFSALVASIGLAVSLLLAVMADRVIRGAGVYKTLLVWPYAVAPAVGGRAVGLPVQSLGRRRRLDAARRSASTSTT